MAELPKSYVAQVESHSIKTILIDVDTVTPGATLEQVQAPEYLGVISSQLAVGNQVRITSALGGYEILLRVESVGDGAVATGAPLSVVQREVLRRHIFVNRLRDDVTTEWIGRVRSGPCGPNAMVADYCPNQRSLERLGESLAQHVERAGPTFDITLSPQVEIGAFDIGAAEAKALTRGPQLISILCPFDGSGMWCRLALSRGEVAVGEKFRTSPADHLRTTFSSPAWLSWSATSVWLLRPTWVAVELFPELTPPKAKTSFADEDPNYQELVEAQRRRAATRQRRSAVQSKDRVGPKSRWSNG